MNIFDYTVIKTGERATGPIAQDFRVLYPELVSSAEDGLLTVSQPTPWQIVKAIQELIGRVSGLEERLNAQQAQIEDLQKQINQLTK